MISRISSIAARRVLANSASKAIVGSNATARFCKSTTFAVHKRTFFKATAASMPVKMIDVSADTFKNKKLLYSFDKITSIIIVLEFLFLHSPFEIEF